MDTRRLRGSSFKGEDRRNMQLRNLRFHDLRGTAATRFYAVGLSERVIAEIMGWKQAHVARMLANT